MTRVFAAIYMGFLTTVVSGCAMSVASPKTCEFPHKGNGGVLNEKGGYIDGSVLVWTDVANNCFSYVSDPKGRDALNSWNDASEKFNAAMKNGDEDESFRMLHKANDSFNNVAPHISDTQLKMYFKKVYEEFGDLLQAKNLQNINDYMVGAYSQFKDKLGC